MTMQRIPRDPDAGSPRWQLALAVGLCLAMLVGLTSIARLAETRLGSATGLLDGFGPAEIGKLRAVKFDAQGRSPPGIAATARAALPSAPLAYEPFFGVAAAGFRAKGAYGSAADTAMLREALRRNPRSREARVLLMRNAVGNGQLKEAIEQLAVLNRFNSSSVGQLMQGLGAAIINESQVEAAVAALKPHPELYQPFVTGFAAAGKPAPLTIQMVSRLPKEALSDPVVGRLAIDELVKVQAFGTARALWQPRSGKPGAAGLVYSPDFADAAAPPPFNWELTVNDKGAAERAKGGGVGVAYYGRSPGPLVSQLLTLAPGNYTAKLAYRTLSGKPGGQGLEVRCATTQDLLAIRPLEGKIDSEEELALAFAVPAQGCSGQFLAVVGRALETRETHETLLTRLSVATGGGR